MPWAQKFVSLRMNVGRAAPFNVPGGICEEFTTRSI